jgi:hypothetical protein
MSEYQATLPILTSIVIFFESLILGTQRLNKFDKTYLWLLILIQALTVIATIFSVNSTLKEIILRPSHVVFGLSIFLGSLLAKNRWLLFLIIGTAVISQAARVYQNGCAYHKHIEAFKCNKEYFFLGCVPAKLLYFVSLFIIIVRYWLGLV